MEDQIVYVTEGKKNDAHKKDWSVLDYELIEPLVDVLIAGKEKYGRGNWKKSFGEDYSYRFRAALRRHDKESSDNPLKINYEDGKVYHLAQIAANALFELYHAKQREDHGFIPNHLKNHILGDK